MYSTVSRASPKATESWPELVEAHGRFVEDYNAQAHWAHRERADGCRSPAEVLGFASGVRHREAELKHAFFSSWFWRTLDSLGYTRLRHWRVYGEEGLVGREVVLWLAAESLSAEHGGELLSRYDAAFVGDTGELRAGEHGPAIRDVAPAERAAADTLRTERVRVAQGLDAGRGLRAPGTASA
jgi:hypothetical protein